MEVLNRYYDLKKKAKELMLTGSLTEYLKTLKELETLNLVLTAR